MASTDIIIHDEKDNVGVVVIEKITPNQDCNCWIMENDGSIKIKSKNAFAINTWGFIDSNTDGFAALRLLFGFVNRFQNRLILCKRDLEHRIHLR